MDSLSRSYFLNTRRNAGIAFFGGGKNYGVFEMKGDTDAPYNSYSVSLADVGVPYLQAAAGNEEFYFIIYDRSSAFTPEEQEKLIGSGS